MDNTSASRISGGNSKYGREGSDLYPTPPEATEALLMHLNLPHNTRIWEPACGEGHMANVFIRNGYQTIATDIEDYAYGTSGIDFLRADAQPCDWIITNPPFKLAERFIRRCAEHKKPFALLLKSQYWNAKIRYQLFHEIQPTEILPLTWRPDFLFKTRGSGSPLMDMMWVVWGEKTSERTTFLPLRKPIKEATQ